VTETDRTSFLSVLQELPAELSLIFKRKDCD